MLVICWSLPPFDLIGRLKFSVDSVIRYSRSGVNRVFEYLRPSSKVPKVVIFQMGKVGSTSLQEAVSRAYGKRNVIHAHSYYLSDDLRWLHSAVLRGSDELRLISLTRAPLDHAVSVFFQAFYKVLIGRESSYYYFYLPRLFKAIRSGPLRKLSDGTLTIEELRELFLNDFEYDISYRWFDDEIKAPFGIDVYETIFPEGGYREYDNGGTRLLVMKHELEEELKLNLMQVFLSLSKLKKSPRLRVMEENEYLGELYRRFKREVKLPKEYVERACESRYFKYFYTPAEIEQQRRKWSE